MIEILSPQQQIFNEVYKVCYQLGYDVYDYLPATEVSYPFVFLGEQFDNDRVNKSTVTGLVTQIIHVYDDYRKRGDVTTMMDSIKRELRKLKHTNNFYITTRNINSQTLPDNSTAQALIHGIVEVEFSFN